MGKIGHLYSIHQFDGIRRAGVNTLLTFGAVVGAGYYCPLPIFRFFYVIYVCGTYIVALKRTYTFVVIDFRIHFLPPIFIYFLGIC